VDNLLLSTLNSRFWDTNTGEIGYSTSEQAGLWLQSGSKFEANANASKFQRWERLYADAQYEHRWANGLTTGAGAFGLRHTNKDSTDANRSEAGPLFIVSIAKDLSGYIRCIENSHLIRIAAVRGYDMPIPEIDYAFYFRLKMPPDISIMAELGANIQGQKSGNLSAGIYLHAGF
jgi:hypothetical protein